MIPGRDRAMVLLRGIAVLTAALAVMILAGVMLGLAMSKVAGGDEPPALGEPTAPTGGVSMTDPKTAGRQPARRAANDAIPGVRVRVISAILHPAATPSGQRRRRGRLGVHVEVHNGGPRNLILAPPSLLAAAQRTRSGSRLGSIPAGRSVDVTLRFETKGAVTAQLATQKTGRIMLAQRSWPISVKVGKPANSSARSAVIQAHRPR